MKASYRQPPMPESAGLTVERAKQLYVGQVLLHRLARNADGTPQRWRVTSIKTWVRRAGAVELHLSRGLYEHVIAVEPDPATPDMRRSNAWYSAPQWKLQPVSDFAEAAQ